MEAEISIDFGSSPPEQEEIRTILEEIGEDFPEADLQLDEGEGAFAVPPADPFTLYLTAATSVQLFACLYPKLKSKISGIGGEANLDNFEEVAKGYLDAHTRISKNLLERDSIDYDGSYICFTYEYLEDGSVHYIEVDRDDISDWFYEER